MATQLQSRRGTTAQMNAFTGAEGEIAVNTSTDTLHVHDGSTAGGHALAKADGSNIATYAGSFTTIAASGTITGNLTGDVTGDLTGSVLTAAQTNITSVGTLSALTVTGNITVGTNDTIFAENNIRFKSTGAAYIDHNTVGQAINFRLSNASSLDKTVMTLTSAGEVGIGMAPQTVLDLQATDNLALRFYNSTSFKAGIQVPTTAGDMIAGSAVNDLAIRSQTNMLFATGGNTERMRITSAGALELTGPGGAGETFLNFTADSNTTKAQISAAKAGASGGRLVFSTNNSSGTLTERMRIDSSGNFMVGGTQSNPTGANVAGASIDASGEGNFSVDGAEALRVNRLTSDGAIVQFMKAGQFVGSIGAAGGDLYIGTGAISWKFFDAGGAILPADANGGAKDNAVNLGSASARMEILFAGTGTINTSDRNEKQDIETLSDAEQRVAVACKGLLRKFRWIDSVETKGDDARIHFGIIAQDLQAAFTAEGLDAARYAMFCSDTWTDEETGEERTRLGVRYSELLAFIIAAI